MAGSKGLEYWEREDGTCSVWGMGECTDTDVVIPRRNPKGKPVTEIAMWAFRNEIEITSVTIPDSVTYIGAGAFGGCKSLASITIPDGVTYIGNAAFEGCDSLKSITFPKGMTTIGEEVIALGTILGHNSKIESIVIPEGVTAIGDNAFYGCTSLKEITIPASVTSIGNSAFGGCYNITSMNIDANNTVYHSEGNCLIETASKTLLMAGKDFVIPDDGSVTSIDEKAFSNRTDLESIVIPDCVTSIGASAFGYCRNLTSVTASGNVGKRAFNNCEGLTSVILLDGVTKIDSEAFYWCKNLEAVTIPATVTYIGDSAFFLCSALKKVNYSGTKAQWMEITIGENNDNLTMFHYIHCSDGDLYM
jgi:hypothetical protein